LSAATFEGDVIGYHFEANPAHGLLDQEVFGERTRGTAVADDPAGRGDRIDDDVITDGDSGHLGTDLHHFARRFVAQRHLPLMRRESAHRDVQRVASA
jgi:hypothetical protein